MSDEPSDKNLFMMCQELNTGAFSDLPSVYHFRNCRPDELDLWKRMSFDTPEEVESHVDYMDDFFERVYADDRETFYKTCLVACDTHDKPVGTAFIWKTYDAFNTVHWLKVLRGHEGRGIGRALLSRILGPLKDADFPVYLHTQPESGRAIKLYTDFGFVLLSDPTIGCRDNHLRDGLAMLRHTMPPDVFKQLRTAAAPQEFLDHLKTETQSEF